MTPARKLVLAALALAPLALPSAAPAAQAVPAARAVQAAPAAQAGQTPPAGRSDAAARAGAVPPATQPAPGPQLPARPIPPDRRLNVAFLVWDGMELIESMGPAHVFAFAPGMDEYTVGRTTGPIRSAFVTIVPEHTLESCPPPDVLVMPGGSIDVPRTDPAWRAFLLEHVPRAELVVSVCNSAILLADLGLLDGREATCGDANLDDLMLLGKDVRAYVNRRWVHSGNVVTSESYYAGLDSALYAVRVLRGPEGEAEVARWSNGGDLSRWDALHAEPGRIPVSRRREIVRLLRDGGVDAALARFAAWEASGEPAYDPELARFAETDLFQWMAWGHQRVGRHELSVAICQFKARAWPHAAAQHAWLGEALMKAARPEEAAAALLDALALDPRDRRARSFAESLLEAGELPAGEPADALRAALGGRDTGG
jgi:putative intracellular protease/amidase